MKRTELEKALIIQNTTNEYITKVSSKNDLFYYETINGNIYTITDDLIITKISNKGE